MNFRRLLLSFSICFVFGLAFGQEFEIVNHLKHFRLDSVTLLLDKTRNYPNVQWQNRFLKHFNTKRAEFNLDTLQNYNSQNQLDQFYSYINIGDYFFYKYLDKNIIALKNYRKALELAEKDSNSILACEAIKKILTLHRIDYLYDNVTYIPYLKKYKNYAYDELELAYYHYYNLILKFKNYEKDKWEIESQEYLDNYFKNNENPYLKGIAYLVYASYYEELSQSSKMWYYVRSAETELTSISSNYKDSRLQQLHAFTARIAVKENKLQIAKNALTKASQNSHNKIDYKIKSLVDYYQGILDTIEGDFRSAFYKFIEYDISQDSIRKSNYNYLMNDLEVKYQTSEKEKQNLQLQNDIEKGQRQKRNLWIIGIAILLTGSIFGFLIYKNTKRKQLLAEKDKILETQKLVTVLKEQELTAIDAMIEGQEKERQRIANDLHDDLGGLMATVKLHFNALKDKQSPELFDKTNTLLDEAYNKIRTVAHAKNSGVIAKQGLLKAVKEMAHAVSISNKISIDVIDHGLDERLENSLELTIFRIIQELITNVIKHAQATEATIHITNHEDSLNIMVEDNGKGFDTKKILKTSGMGIHSIDKRIENLGGTVTIESELNKGTTVIIDIPS